MIMFWMANGPAPTTGPMAKVATGTATKTLLQLAPPAGRLFEVLEWGISFDGFTAATPILCELLETDVAATVTAHVASGMVKWDDPNGASSVAMLAVAGTGYTATVEGATAATRMADQQLVSPTAQYIRQWAPGAGFKVLASKFARIRVTAAASVGASCYMIWREL